MIAQTSITLVQRLVPLILALTVAVSVIELIRRRRLREEYAMLWICASGVLLVFAAVPQLVMWAANALGVYYVTLMVLLSFCFLSLVLVHLSVAVSRSADDVRKLAQRTALLEQKLSDNASQSNCEPLNETDGVCGSREATQPPDTSA